MIFIFFRILRIRPRRAVAIPGGRESAPPLADALVIVTCVACAVGILAQIAAAGESERGVGVSPPPRWVRPVAEAPAAPVGSAGAAGSTGPAGHGSAPKPEGGSEYLLVDHQCDVASMSSYVHTVTRILDVASFDEGPGLRIEYDPAYERLDVHYVRLRRAGATIDLLSRQNFKTLQREENLDQDLYDAQLTAFLLMEDLRGGDTLDYAYTIAGQNPVFGGRFMESITWSYGVPVRRRGVILRVPDGRRIEAWPSRGIPAPVISRVEGATEYRWSGSELPAVREDEDTPPWYDPYPGLRFSEFHSWKDVADWARGVYAAETAAGVELRSLVERLRAGRADDEGFAAAAVQFVQDEVRYFGVEIGEDSHRPSSPSTVLRRRFGDCKDKAVLLCALLANSPARAEPVLVDSYAGDRVDPGHPWPLAFDHVIVRITLGAREYYVDPTASFQRGGLAERCVPAEMKGLVIGPGPDTLLGIPAGCGNAPVTTYLERFLCAAADSVLVEAVTTYSGSDADGVRSLLAQRAAAELEEEGRRYYEEEFGGARQLAPMTTRDDTAKNIVVVTERYAVDSFWTGSGEERGTTLRPSTILDAIGEAPPAGRTAPLELPHPVTVRARVALVLPEPWGMGESADSVVDPSFRFRTRVSESGDTVLIDYEYTSLRDWVAPEEMGSYAANVSRARDLAGMRLPGRPAGVPGPGLIVPIAVLLFIIGGSAGALIVFRRRRMRARAVA